MVRRPRHLRRRPGPDREAGRGRRLHASSRSWTTCGRSGTSARRSTRCSRPTPTLGYLAAVTERVELLAWVTAAVYREPGLLAKEVTTLDVLSRGRAWLGIGAAWNEEESRGLGLPFPPHRRAVRAARGDAADLPADVERRRRAVRGQALPRSAAPSTRRSRCNGRTRRSSSAAAARGRRCGWSRSTPTPATSSTAPSWRTSSTCCASTARRSAATTTTIEKTVMCPIDPGPERRERRRDPRAPAATSPRSASTHVQSRGLDGSRTDWLEVIGERIIPEINRF